MLPANFGKRPKMIFGRISLLLVFISVLSCSGTDSNQPLTQNGNWFVSRVVDGDTFFATNNGQKEKIRLIGVDAPEARNVGKKKKHPFGKISSQYLKDLIENKYVRLELDIDQRDQYGRLLAYVYLMNGTFVNAELVRLGYATVMTVPPNVKFADKFLELQKEAREKKLGFWGAEYANE